MISQGGRAMWRSHDGIKEKCRGSDAAAFA